MVPVPVPVPYIRGRAGQPGATLSLDACERRLSIGVNINESPTDMVCGAGGAPSSDYAMDLSRNHVIHTHTPRSLRSETSGARPARVPGPGIHTVGPARLIGNHRLLRSCPSRSIETAVDARCTGTDHREL